MLKISVVTKESYDETTEKFVSAECVDVELEHSLVSLSKWESVWEKPFLSKEERTEDETISYIRMMIVGPEPSSEVFYHLLANHIEEIKDYVGRKNTGTTFPAKQEARNRETITSELIYYWMSSMNIPMACENWHLSKLFTLIQVHSVKNSPKKKMSLEERRALNRQRRAQANTSG